MSTVGQRIKVEREKRGWTQAQLSDMLSIKIGTLSGYERDYRQPDLAMLQKLAAAFNVTTDCLLGRAVTEAPIPNAQTTRNPDIRVISRAGDRMTDEQARSLRRVAEAMFPELFDDKK